MCILEANLPNDTAKNKIEALYMTLFETRNRAKGYNYLDRTHDTGLWEKKFYPICSNPKDGIYDPRKRFKRGYEKPDRAKIHYMRISKGLSGPELAKAFGVTRQAVSLWERGVSRPSKDMQKKIADYFGVTVDDLLRPGADAQGSE